MKAIATLIFSVALCGLVRAAPITSVDSVVDVVGVEETAQNQGNGLTTIGEGSNGNSGTPSSEAIPEPATLMLLGIGMGLAALRRKI